MTPDWITILIPFLSGAAGVGVAWGVSKTNMEEHDRRINKLEEKLELQVGVNRCDQMRDECRDDLRAMLAEIKAEIIGNRNWVTDRFTEIARFMGKMNGTDHRL